MRRARALASRGPSRACECIPGREVHPDGVHGTAACHHHIADARLPQADPVCDDATTLHTAVDMLHAPSAIVQGLMGQWQFQRQRLASWLLGRQQDPHMGQRQCQEAQILQQLAPRGQARGRCVSNGLLMDATAIGVAAKEDREQGMDQDNIFAQFISICRCLK
jgi:hypothetical protein